MLAVLEDCWHRSLLGRLFHCGFRQSIKKSPAAGRPDAGLRTTSFATTSTVKTVWPSSLRLRDAQILSSRLPSPAICNDLEGDLLPLVERAHAGAFDRADMNEDILVAALRLNEAKAFLGVKPLHSSLVHGSSSFWYMRVQAALLRSRLVQVLGRKSSVGRAIRGQPS